ncbi:MAG: hypothetical protein J3Q66DRAFT_406800 [Benniella sp.]|nr:MAG: hypothetical protein J3Q66DRAFT_406800 [Benniella sp.]
MATELPELRQRIIQYLDFATLKAFSLVCKAWYLDARPLLWSRFKCEIPQECLVSPEEYALWLDTIRKNAISFRHIRHFGDREPTMPGIYDTLLDRCHSLISIRMLISTSNFPSPVVCWEDTLRSLIEQNRVTLRLELQLTEGLPIAFLPSLLAGLPHLRSLELSTKEMIVEDLLAILDGFPSSLERFSLITALTRRTAVDQGDSVNHPDNYSIPSVANPLRLKYLRMPYSDIQGTMEDILSRVAVHSLQGFRIDTAYCLRISPIVRDALWRLTRLHVQEFQVEERALPGILEAIHPHQLRHVYVRTMNTECTAKLIERQHQSLESLNVGFEKTHAGALADILSTCGSLRSLTFLGLPFVNIGTLIDPQKPWACTALEVFEGYFGLSIPVGPHAPDPLASDKSVDATTSRRIEEQFMRRLGQLTNLRCVVQYEYGRDAVNHQLRRERMEKRIMEWSLASGLEHLHGLVNLRTFKILDQGSRKRIRIPEMTFIKQHWHSLKEMVRLFSELTPLFLFFLRLHLDQLESPLTDVSLIEIHYILDRPSP